MSRYAFNCFMLVSSRHPKEYCIGVMIAKLFAVAIQVAGVETSGREHDAILYDLASESQTRIDIRQAGSPVSSSLSAAELQHVLSSLRDSAHTPIIA